MKKIEFKDLPIEETPLDAYTLNLLQKNVEDEFNTLNKYFEIPQGDNRRRWVKIAEFPTNVGSGDNRIQMRIYGTIRYGSNKPGMDMIEISTRGGMNISIYAFNHTTNNDNQRYGYVNKSNGRTEFWIEQGTYNYRSKVEIINADNGDVKLFEIKYEQPASLIMIDKEVVATEKTLLAVYNNQTGNIRIDGANYEAKQVPFKDVFTQRGTAFRLGANEIIVNKKCNARITFTLYCQQSASGEKYNIEAKLWANRRWK
jgi:hypothetical protein